MKLETTVRVLNVTEDYRTSDDFKWVTVIDDETYPMTFRVPRDCQLSLDQDIKLTIDTGA